MIAQTPPMGWNSWDCYGAAVTEDAVRKNAAYMAEKLKPFGWEYVVVDIQWARPNALDHSYEPFVSLTTLGSNAAIMTSYCLEDGKNHCTDVPPTVGIVVL